MSDVEAARLSFYDRHQADLPRLFEIVGVEVTVADSLDSAVAATQPWVRGDHIRPEEHFTIDKDDEPELRELYDRFGLTQERGLLPSHYDQILMLGGTYWGSNHRLEFLRVAMEHGDVTTDRLILLGGEREIFSEEEPSVCEDMLRLHATQFCSLEAGASSAHVYWETDMLHLAALKQLGNLVTLNPTEAADGKDRDRPHVQEFSWRDVPLAIMHTRAVERNGQARHTTEACMVDWLETAAPESEARVALIAANPHTTRVGRSANAMLRSRGREDIALLPAGPGVLPRVGHHTYLGEVARHLYEDTRLATPELGLADGPGIAGERGVVGQ